MEEQKGETLIYEQFSENIKMGFVAAFIGKPGSGKTHLINELVKKIMPSGYFSYIFVCCPSDAEYKGITFPSQISKVFTPEYIKKMINMVNLNNKEKKFTNLLLIIDDCISEVKETEKDDTIISLFFNRRHLLWYGGVISIIISTQKYTMIPARFRTTITNLALFSISPFDCKKVLEESIVTFKKSDWERYIAEIFKVEHAYILVNIAKQSFLTPYSYLPGT